MRGFAVILVVAATAMPAVVSAQEETVDGSARAMRAVVSSKT